MNNIRIEKTAKSPLVVMKDGYMGLMGRSIPQNSRQLYQPCFDWVNEYVKNPSDETQVEIYFEYVDTSSIRCVVDLLSQLEDGLKNRSMTVTWYYERYDDDLHELGTYIQTYLKVPFKYVEVDEGQEIKM